MREAVVQSGPTNLRQAHSKPDAAVHPLRHRMANVPLARGNDPKQPCSPTSRTRRGPSEGPADDSITAGVHPLPPVEGLPSGAAAPHRLPSKVPDQEKHCETARTNRSPNPPGQTVPRQPPRATIGLQPPIHVPQPGSTDARAWPLA